MQGKTVSERYWDKSKLYISPDIQGIYIQE